MRALSVKNKIGFIDGSISKPTDPAKLAEWMREDGLVIGWIHAAILPNIKDSASYAPIAYLLWKDIENRHVESCAPKIYQLKQQLASIKQDGSSMMGFYGRLRAIWDEMDVIRPVSTCICANAKDAIDHLNQDRAMEFLQGLHDRYAGLRSNILQHIEFPPLLTIYNLVRQEEVQQSLANTILIVESATLAVARHEGDSSSKTNKKRSYYCDYCHKDGHTRDRCYKLNGYPPKYKRKDGTTLDTTSAVLQGVLP
ncbi:uncharacterized protein LOC113352311 [Papaver somniferum]|uniref:uncharacterized protein LOC113352311 n=1 Tax=Papaver somniferum TaxID=3469 RepID=UPI000E6FEDC4|nr:uncharacterized protein LOC113352311 [Papaver somniferum]